MAVESGRKVAVGVGRETTRGTSVAPGFWAKHLELDFMQKAEKAVNESGLGVLDKGNSADVMKDWGEGTLTGKVTDKTFGLILAAAFGAAPTTTDNADSNPVVKDHTYAQSQLNDSLALTVALKDLNRDERYAMAMLNELEISGEVGDWNKFSAGLISRKPATASNTIAYVAENEFKPKHTNLKLAANLAGLTGASPINIRSYSIKVSRNVNPYFVLGSNDPNNIFAHELEISGEFVLLFDSLTHRDSYLASSYQAMRLEMINTDVTIGASTNPKVQLNFARVSFTDWGVDQGLENMVEQTVGVSALYSLADGKSWDGLITNDQASY